MPGRVDQVEDVVLAVVGRVAHAHGLGLDRDAALALEIHLVEELRALSRSVSVPGRVEQAVGQRALAVVDVRDDAEVADASRAVTGRSPFARARSRK